MAHIHNYRRVKEWFTTKKNDVSNLFEFTDAEFNEFFCCFM